MNCPKCESRSGTRDSRPVDGGVKRRRVCTGCGLRFSTIEITVEHMDAIEQREERNIDNAVRAMRRLANRLAARDES